MKTPNQYNLCEKIKTLRKGKAITLYLKNKRIERMSLQGVDMLHGFIIGQQDSQTLLIHCEAILSIEVGKDNQPGIKKDISHDYPSSKR